MATTNTTQHNVIYQQYKLMIQSVSVSLGSQDVDSIVYNKDMPAEYKGKSALDALQHLERIGDIGYRKVDPLIELLQGIGRFDLVSKHVQPYKERYNSTSSSKASQEETAEGISPSMTTFVQGGDSFEFLPGLEHPLTAEEEGQTTGSPHQGHGLWMPTTTAYHAFSSSVPDSTHMPMSLPDTMGTEPLLLSLTEQTKLQNLLSQYVPREKLEQSGLQSLVHSQPAMGATPQYHSMQHSASEGRYRFRSASEASTDSDPATRIALASYGVNPRVEAFLASPVASNRQISKSADHTLQPSFSDELMRYSQHSIQHSQAHYEQCSSDGGVQSKHTSERSSRTSMESQAQCFTDSGVQSQRSSVTSMEHMDSESNLSLPLNSAHSGLTESETASLPTQGHPPGSTSIPLSVQHPTKPFTKEAGATVIWKVKRDDFILPIFHHKDKCFEKKVKLNIGTSKQNPVVTFKLYPNGLNVDKNRSSTLKVEVTHLGKLERGMILQVNITGQDCHSGDIIVSRQVENSLNHNSFLLPDFISHEIIKLSNARNFQFTATLHIADEWLIVE